MNYEKTGVSPYTAFRYACKLVVEHCPNQYAKAYAKAGLVMHLNIDEIRTQALYIRSNLGHWRHPVANEVRTLLKEVE